MKISYSAPAKVILSGEHSVVFGKPAFVSALDLRLRFTLWEEKKNQEKEKSIQIIEKSVKEYLQNKKIRYEDKIYAYSIQSDIPIGRGLGSSAALGVAGAAAFLEFYTGKEFSRDEINMVAYSVEKYFHKNPSGVDPSTSCFGGLIYYRKEFEFLKQISALTFKIPRHIENKLFLIDTGKPLETTAVMIESVGKLYNKEPAMTENVLNEMEKITKRMVLSIIKEDELFFRDCLFKNEILLEKLNIVSRKAKKIIKNLSQYGTGKITGGGGKKAGSGIILFLAEDEQKMRSYCVSNDIPVLKFIHSHEGVKKESL
ncbi:MAG: hypothetical protein Q7S61_04350 [bacterium]|nr:hypothetical protein [bacterium]